MSAIRGSKIGCNKGNHVLGDSGFGETETFSALVEVTIFPNWFFWFNFLQKARHPATSRSKGGLKWFNHA